MSTSSFRLAIECAAGKFLSFEISLATNNEKKILSRIQMRKQIRKSDFLPVKILVINLNWGGKLGSSGRKLVYTNEKLDPRKFFTANLESSAYAIFVKITHFFNLFNILSFQKILIHNIANFL